MAKPPRGIAFTQKISREARRVLTPEALAFIGELQRASQGQRQRLLVLRAERQAGFDKGVLPDFHAGTAAIRGANWKVAAIPRDLLDQRTAIIQAPSRKDILTGLNSGAKLCLADFADFTAPAWDKLIDGQINLMDRWTSAMDHVDPATNKRVSLSQRLAVLMVRPRPLHLDEPRVTLDGTALSASIFDAGLYLFHNARVALAKASGPYLCLSGIESRHEARLWNDVLVHAQSLLELPVGSIRANVMIDNAVAAFDMDEIIHELRDHIAALTLDAGRYAFSQVRNFGARKSRVIADVAELDAALSGLLVRTAHKRGCLALLRGGSNGEPERAVRDGFDGLWMTDTEQVQRVAKIFNDDMPTPNQIYVTRDDVMATQKHLLHVADGPRTDAALRHNVRVALLTYEAWLSGRGSVAIDGVICDAASAELRRARLWQWLRHGAVLDTGKLTPAMFEQCLAETLKPLKPADGRFREAAALLKSLVLAKTCAPDFTVLAMRKLA